MAETGPVGCAVASPLEPRGVDKGFGHIDRMAPALLPVRAETTKIEGKNPGGEVAHPDPRWHEEADVIDYQMFPLLSEIGGL